jgi:hypothetical protein
VIIEHLIIGMVFLRRFIRSNTPSLNLVNSLALVTKIKQNMNVTPHKLSIPEIDYTEVWQRNHLNK